MPYYLKLLDLSYNNLTKNSIKFLNLCDNNELNELYMQWNKLLGEGGYLLFKDLIENKNLKVYFMIFIMKQLKKLQSQERVVWQINITCLPKVSQYRLDLVLENFEIQIQKQKKLVKYFIYISERKFLN